jgi:hypothetical protein
MGRHRNFCRCYDHETIQLKINCEKSKEHEENEIFVFFGFFVVKLFEFSLSRLNLAPFGDLAGVIAFAMANRNIITILHPYAYRPKPAICK